MKVNSKHNLLTRYVGVFIIIVILFSGCSSSSSNSEQIPSEKEVPAPDSLVELVPPENSDNISKENFDKITNGMSLIDVEVIIAGTKELVLTNQTNGKKIEIYKWETSDSTRSIEVTFENEKVISKKEKGLK